MRIFFNSKSEIPSTSANSVYCMKIAEAFALNGHKVTLIVECKNETNLSELYNIYGVKGIFRIKSFKNYFSKRTSFLKNLQIVFYLYFKKKDLLITRDIKIAALATFLGLKIILDAHSVTTSTKIYQRVLVNRFYKSSNLLRIVAIANVIKEIFIKKGVPANKIVVIKSAGNSENISSKTIDKIVSVNKLHAGYVGHLYEGKGMEVISSIASLLPTVNFHVVGGRPEELEYWKLKLANCKNVIFYGFIIPKELSPYINSFDICLLPNQKVVKGAGNHSIGEITSPLKMLDYMGHKKPIIASDLPVLREVLDETTAVFCNPEKPAEWVSAIEKLKDDKALRLKLAGKAYDVFIHNYTWKKRAEKMLV